MKRFFTFIMVAVVTLFLQGCFGSGGSSAPPPNNVVVAAKDSRVVVTWDMVPGVEYWIFRAVGTGITPTTCSSMPLCSTTLKVTSPLTVSGLSNGTTYSFTINGRTGGGPGGAGSPAIQATPRLAGATWTVGTPTAPASNLRSVAYYGGTFVATGDSRALFTSTNGNTWTAVTTNLPAINFNAVSYDASRARYLVAGAGGAIYVSSDTVTWTQQAIGTTTWAQNAIANTGTGITVVTGANGTILYSSDGSTWAAQVSGTTNALNGLTYGNGTFVAVGAGGTILHSSDGITWAVVAASGTASNLMGVTYGLEAGRFVAVGVGGTVLTSPDGTTWTLQTPIAAATTLNAVTYLSGRRFVAADNNGSIFYSEYSSLGATWAPVTVTLPYVAAPLYAVTTGGLFDYSVVGAAGLNLYSD